MDPVIYEVFIPHLLGGSDSAKEGTWVWTDGSLIKTTYWNTREPNGKRGENCLVANWANSKWNDYACKNKLRYVCKKGKVFNPW